MTRKQWLAVGALAAVGLYLYRQRQAALAVPVQTVMVPQPDGSQVPQSVNVHADFTIPSNALSLLVGAALKSLVG